MLDVSSFPSVPDAWPKNLQAALREQAPEIPSARRVRGSGGVNGHSGHQTKFSKALYQLCTRLSLTAMDDLI